MKENSTESNSILVVETRGSEQKKIKNILKDISPWVDVDFANSSFEAQKKLKEEKQYCLVLAAKNLVQENAGLNFLLSLGNDNNTSKKVLLVDKPSLPEKVDRRLKLSDISVIDSKAPNLVKKVRIKTLIRSMFPKTYSKLSRTKKSNIATTSVARAVMMLIFAVSVLFVYQSIENQVKTAELNKIQNTEAKQLIKNRVRSQQINESQWSYFEKNIDNVINKPALNSRSLKGLEALSSIRKNQLKELRSEL